MNKPVSLSTFGSITTRSGCDTIVKGFSITSLLKAEKKHQVVFSYFILRNPLHLLEWFPPSSSIHNFENFPHKSHLHDDRDKMPVTWVFPELLVCKVITAPSRLSFDIIIIILGISKHTLLLYFRLCSHPL